MMDYDGPFTHQSQGQAFYKLTASKWSIDPISNKQVLWSPPLKYNPSFFSQGCEFNLFSFITAASWDLEMISKCSRHF